ncbi:hypothetical protein OsccyDRAFT_3450 [Leptolyngbyaceae cyanobacterium JSC-12]|nr:hypothetical protein OsccyDRAFT_3450 [Leptolyngbyaceae cyanobacterium JSC-12]
MDNSDNPKLEQSGSQMQKAIDFIWDAAYESRNDTLKLLEILRKLENLHQQIRDSFFQESLPTSRQALYALLKDIEAKGGWPYIYRVKLQELMERMNIEDLQEAFSMPAESTFNSQIDP